MKHLGMIGNWLIENVRNMVCVRYMVISQENRLCALSLAILYDKGPFNCNKLKQVSWPSKFNKLSLKQKNIYIYDIRRLADLTNNPFLFTFLV